MGEEGACQSGLESHGVWGCVGGGPGCELDLLDSLLYGTSCQVLRVEKCRYNAV